MSRMSRMSIFKIKRSGYNAYHPNINLHDVQPFEVGSLECKLFFKHWMAGWLEAEEEEKAKSSFYEHNEDCPWFESGECMGSTGECCEDNCPIIFWKDK